MNSKCGLLKDDDAGSSCGYLPISLDKKTEWRCMEDGYLAPAPETHSVSDLMSHKSLKDTEEEDGSIELQYAMNTLCEDEDHRGSNSLKKGAAPTKALTQAELKSMYEAQQQVLERERLRERQQQRHSARPGPIRQPSETDVSFSDLHNPDRMRHLVGGFDDSTFASTADLSSCLTSASAYDSVAQERKLDNFIQEASKLMMEVKKSKYTRAPPAPHSFTHLPPVTPLPPQAPLQRSHSWSRTPPPSQRMKRVPSPITTRAPSPVQHRPHRAPSPQRHYRPPSPSPRARPPSPSPDHHRHHTSLRTRPPSPSPFRAPSPSQRPPSPLRAPSPHARPPSPRLRAPSPHRHLPPPPPPPYLPPAPNKHYARPPQQPNSARGNTTPHSLPDTNFQPIQRTQSPTSSSSSSYTPPHLSTRLQTSSDSDTEDDDNQTTEFLDQVKKWTLTDDALMDDDDSPGQLRLTADGLTRHERKYIQLVLTDEDDQSSQSLSLAGYDQWKKQRDLKKMQKKIDSVNVACSPSDEDDKHDSPVSSSSNLENNPKVTSPPVSNKFTPAMMQQTPPSTKPKKKTLFSLFKKNQNVSAKPIPTTTPPPPEEPDELTQQKYQQYKEAKRKKRLELLKQQELERQRALELHAKLERVKEQHYQQKGIPSSSSSLTASTAASTNTMGGTWKSVDSKTMPGSTLTLGETDAREERREREDCIIGGIEIQLGNSPHLTEDEVLSKPSLGSRKISGATDNTTKCVDNRRLSLIGITQAKAMDWTQSQPPTMDCATAEAPPLECVVCDKGRRTHLAIPCMHLSFCGDCVKDMQERGCKVCPVCKEPNVTFSKVYF